MNNSDSDSSWDIRELGLPTIISNEKDNLSNGLSNEESKEAVDENANEDHVNYKKSEKFNKFRVKAKDLVSKIEKQRLVYLNNSSIVKSGENSATTDVSNTIPDNLEINDPRLKYDIILSKGYKLLKKMGNGAYASVFLGEKLSDPEKKCVLKISIGEERIPDTQNEYKIMSNLKSHRMPRVFQLIIDKDYFYSIICMEYSNIDTNVLQYVNQHGNLEESEVKQALKELFEALKYIHSLDYAHRDVKPDNVLIKVEEAKNKEDPKKVEVVLVDYNISK